VPSLAFTTAVDDHSTAKSLIYTFQSENKRPSYGKMCEITDPLIGKMPGFPETSTKKG
jgi:hypothetical protein